MGDLPGALMRATDADSPEVRLSADTMEKQAYRHPEMTPEDYARLPELLAAPDLVVASASPRHSLFVKRLDRDLAAVVKRVPGGSGYVVSFRRAERWPPASAQVLFGTRRRDQGGDNGE